MWIISILILIFILGIIILVHEFGHFIWAKKFKVHIYEFSIGMGPIIHTHKGKDKIDVVLPKFLDFIEDYTIIGHNVKFDYDFIEANITKLHLKHLKNRIVDTLLLSRITIYDSKNHRLKTLKEYL